VKRKFKLLPLVLVCVGALVLVSGGSIVVINYLTTRTIYSELSNRIVVRSLGGMERVLRKHLDAALDQAEFVADTIRSGNPRLDQRERLADFSAGSFAAAPQVTGLIVADARDDVLRITRTAFGTVERDWLTVHHDAQLERAAEEMLRRKDPYWAPPFYRDRHAAALFNVSVPIWLEDAYLGFVGVGISTQALSELAMELSEPPDSRVFVLYGRDKILAHTFLVLQPGGVSQTKPLLGTNDIIDPVINHLDQATPFRSAGFTHAEGIEVLELDLGPTRYFVMAKTITGYTDVPLVIGAYIDASAVDAPLVALRRGILIGTAILVASLILSLFMSRIIARPVRETARSATAIASLDFEQIEPLQPSRIREIDDLATSFNAMLAGLRSFGRYVPRALVARLIQENRAGAGTEERELTVMFTDIVGFTTTCEGMAPAEVATFINHHLTLVSECIEREGGTIDKYIGDAVMAFWGAPNYVDNAPARACRAAAAIQQALAADNDARTSVGLPRVRMRMGVHSGDLIVGDIGAPNRINYTVIGDVVNTAQRLEALGKEINPGAESVVLVSRSVRDGLTAEFKVHDVGHLKVKGKRDELEVFELLGWSGMDPPH
jgi:adenylate cyclase